MYNVKVKVPYIEITDALAAAHALTLSSMVNAIEDELIIMAEIPYTALISLEHACFNATTSTKEKIIEIAVNYLAEFCSLPSFPAILPISLITLIKAAVNKIGSKIEAANVVKALIKWMTENHGEIKVVLPLLDMIPFSALTLSEVTWLSKYAENEKLSFLGKIVANKYKGQVKDDRFVSRCLFTDELASSSVADYEEIANMTFLEVPHMDTGKNSLESLEMGGMRKLRKMVSFLNEIKVNSDTIWLLRMINEYYSDALEDNPELWKNILIFNSSSLKRH